MRTDQAQENPQPFFATIVRASPTFPIIVRVMSKKLQDGKLKKALSDIKPIVSDKELKEAEASLADTKRAKKVRG